MSTVIDAPTFDGGMENRIVDEFTSLLVLAGAVVTPLYTAAVLTVVHLAVNEVLGVRRWTAVLACPAVFVVMPLILYSLARRTFIWGSWRYRWRGKFDVTVVE
jgi:hypothetical protein